MLNCTKKWQPIWHNKIDYNISGGLLYVSSGLAFPAAPAQNILLQKPAAGFFQNSFHKKVPSVVWLLMQKQWSSGRTPETKTVSRVHKNSLHAPREKGRVARAPYSTTVKSQVPARPKTQRKTGANTLKCSTQTVQNPKQDSPCPISVSVLPKREHSTELRCVARKQRPLRQRQRLSFA